MATMVNMNSLLNGKDSRWLQLEVCREFQRNKCSRQDTECKFAHPPANVEVQNGKVTACYDSIKGRCNRDKPPCKYFHPPQHLKDQLLINGRNHLALKNALMQQMGIAPGQPVIPGQVPTVATNPYLTGIPANTYSPYFAPGHLVPTILGPDPSAVASQLGPVVPQAVPVAQQKIPRSDRLEVCREFMRGACKRAESECRFAHPQESVTTHEDGSVTVCMDAVKGRCARDPCRYFHPPLHLQAQIKAAQSRATATAPVSAATHPIPTPGAAPPPNAVTIGHPLEVGKKRAAENDMFQLMDVKTVGSFYYENFAFSNMVPYKRPAAEKSGIPVYQPGATTYQQLMQLQQPFVPVSCEYQSQNPSATTAIPQPQTSTTANPIIANNNTNNHSMVNNNNNFILNNYNHLNNNKTSQVNLNLNTVHNSIASNGILNNNSHHNLNNNATIATTSTTTIAISTTTMSNSNNSNGVVVSNSSNNMNNNIYSLNNTISSNTSNGLLANSLTNSKPTDSSITPATTVNSTQSQSSTANTLNLSLSSSSPTVSSPTEISSSSSIATSTGSVAASTTALQLPGSNSNPSQIMHTQTNTATSPTKEDNNDALTMAVTNANASDSNNSTGNASTATDADNLTTSVISSAALTNITTYSNITNNIPSTTTLPTQVTHASTDVNNTLTLSNGLLKYEQTNGNLAITTTATITETTTTAPATPSISYPITTPNRVYTAPHTSYANVLVPHHHHHLYTPVSSVASTSASLPYSTAASAYSYASYPTQSYATQTYPTTSYYTDPATIAKEVAQKNYANAVKMAAASNALSGKPLTAALNYTGLPLNKAYVTQNQAAAAAAFSHHHHQQQQAAAVAQAAAAAQAAQVAGLRMGSHTVGGTMATQAPTPVSTPSLLPRPPTGYLSASTMMRPQQMSIGATATTTNPYAAAAAAAAAAANQQYLQQHQQHFFYPGMVAGYPFPMAAAGVPGLTSAAGVPGMPSQMQAAQVAQAAAAAAAAQAGAQGSAVVLNPYKKMKTS